MVAEGGPEVGFGEGEARGDEIEVGGVVACEGEGGWGEVGEDDLGVREGGGEGEADDA